MAYRSSILHTSGIPTATPGQLAPRVAFDPDTGFFYTYYDGQWRRMEAVLAFDGLRVIDSTDEENPARIVGGAGSADGDYTLPSRGGYFVMSDSHETRYIASLTQTGTSAPTATVSNNSFGNSIEWTRTAAGTFRATCSASVFTANKTHCFVTLQSRVGLDFTAVFGRVSDTQCELKIFTDAGVAVDGFVAAVQILVFE